MSSPAKVNRVWHRGGFDTKRVFQRTTSALLPTTSPSDTSDRFVCGTLGQTEKGAEDNEGLILNAHAQLAVDGKTGKYPEFKGNAETYINVGEAMGKAMVELMKNE